MNTQNKRNVLLLWSGGCDSTLALAKMMASDDVNSVTALSVVCDMLDPVKNLQEKNSRIYP